MKEILLPILGKSRIVTQTNYRPTQIYIFITILFSRKPAEYQQNESQIWSTMM